MTEPKSNIDPYHMINEQLKRIKKLEAENKKLKEGIRLVYKMQLEVDILNGQWLLKAREILNEARGE